MEYDIPLWVAVAGTVGGGVLGAFIKGVFDVRAGQVTATPGVMEQQTELISRLYERLDKTEAERDDYKREFEQVSSNLAAIRRDVARLNHTNEGANGGQKAVEANLQRLIDSLQRMNDAVGGEPDMPGGPGAIVEGRQVRLSATSSSASGSRGAVTRRQQPGDPDD